MTSDPFRAAANANSDGETGSVPWRGGEIVLAICLVLLYVFVLSVAVVLPVSSLFGKDTTGDYYGRAATVFLLDAGLVAIAYGLSRSKGGTWRDLGFRERWPGVSTGKLVWIVISGLIASVLITDLYAVLIDVAGIDALKPSGQIPTGFFDHAGVVALTGFSVVVMAPIAEETFFRGFVFSGLRRRFGTLPSALASGLLFSAAHTDVGLVIPFSLVGAVLAYTYVRAGTLKASISLHFLFNLLSFVILVSYPDARA
jgi:membrane protease YdiL (CAAX protease family)